ncbi:MAG: 30S ribosome-binding factor RbfA [Mariprofundaceae bacterium]
MNSKSPSRQRIQADIQRLLTIILQRDMNDPCLLGTVITNVDVSRDNQSAVIKVHGMKRENSAAVIDRLKRLRPHFEHSLRKALGKKRLPTLTFLWDDALDSGNDMVELLNKLARS